MRRALATGALTVASLVAALALAVVILARTGVGHSIVRRIALLTVRGPVHGIVRVGRIDGDLLAGAVVHDLAISDSSGAPFIAAARIEVHYTLRDLLHRRLFIEHLRLDHPVVVLARAPDGRWNVTRIFPGRSAGPRDTTPGWGSWITITDARITEGTLLAPPITEVRHLTTVLPLVRLADPADPVRLVRVASLQAAVAAESLPPADVRDLTGAFSFTADSLWWRSAAVALPASALTTTGTYGFAAGDAAIDLQAHPLALADLRFASPRIPPSGQMRGDFALALGGTTQRYEVENLLVTTGGARIAGHGGIERGDSVRILPTDLRFTGIDARVVREVAPDAHVPRDGTLEGRAAFSGSRHLLAVQAEVTYADSRVGTNHVRLAGSLGVAGTASRPIYEARAFTLTLDPARLELAQIAAPAFPARGPLSGTAIIDGSTADSMTIRARVRARVGPIRGAFGDTVDIDTAAVRVTILRNVLRLDSAHVRVHALATTIDAAGSLGLRASRQGRLSYRVAIDSLGPVARLLVAGDTSLHLDSLAGSAAATGTVRGAARRFDLDAAFSGTRLSGFGTHIAGLAGSVTWTGAPGPTAQIVATIHADSTVLRHAVLDTIDAHVAFQKPSGAVTLRATRGPHQELALGATVTLAPAATEIRYDSLRIRVDTTTVRSAHPGVVRWGREGLALDGIDLRATPGAARITVDGTFPFKASPGTPIRLALTMDSVSLETIAALGGPASVVNGTLALRATAAGTLGRPVLHGSAELTNVSAGDQLVPDLHVGFGYDTLTLVAHAELDRSRAMDSSLVSAAQVPSVAAASARPLVVADAAVPLDLTLTDSGPRVLERPVHGSLVVDTLPLALTPLFIPSVSNAAGAITARASVAGTPRHPSLGGSIALTEGRFSIAPLGITLSDVASHAVLAGDTLHIDSLVARSRGQLRALGTIDFTDLFVPALDITTTGHKARILASTTRGTLNVDDSLTIAGPLAALYVYGNVRVRDGTLLIPDIGGKEVIDVANQTVYYVADTTDPGIREIIPKPSPLMANLRMDVDLTVDRNTWVRNKAANVEVYADDPLTVRIGGRQRDFVVDGIVTTDRGQYTFFSKRFEITRGMATFIGAQTLDPTIEATGQYTVSAGGQQPINIQIQIGGTVRAPTLTLTSDAVPPLSQTDLFTYLAFGSPASQLSSGTGGGSSAGGTSGTGLIPSNLAGSLGPYVAQRLAGVAIGTFTEGLQGDVARSLGADVLNITPAPGVPAEVSTSGVTGYLRNTEVEFGKYVTTKTYVGLDVLTIAPPGARVETRLSKNATLTFTLQPWYLADPTLAPTETITTKDVAGVALKRIWRF